MWMGLVRWPGCGERERGWGCRERVEGCGKRGGQGCGVGWGRGAMFVQLLGPARWARVWASTGKVGPPRRLWAWASTGKGGPPRGSEPSAPSCCGPPSTPSQRHPRPPAAREHELRSSSRAHQGHFRSLHHFRHGWRRRGPARAKRARTQVGRAAPLALACTLKRSPRVRPRRTPPRTLRSAGPWRPARGARSRPEQPAGPGPQVPAQPAVQPAVALGPLRPPAGLEGTP